MFLLSCVHGHIIAKHNIIDIAILYNMKATYVIQYKIKLSLCIENLA